MLGFVTGALCVKLVVRRSIWNWPTGLAKNVFYLVLFWQAGLYADAGLQAFSSGSADLAHPTDTASTMHQ